MVNCCSELYTCCDCGCGIEDDGCGCNGCWSCNACENCLENGDDENCDHANCDD